MKNIEGEKFGRLIAINFVIKKKGRYVWRCLCECGNFTEVIVSSLKNGNTKSCGCFQREQASKANLKHGMRQSVEYRAYMHMLTRCFNGNSQFYKDYGGRGISICKRWLCKNNGFKNFLKDMGEKPEGKYSLDRINVNGDYNPRNCRWATDVQQANNRRTHKYSGIFPNGSGWIARIRINGKLKNLGTFKSKDEALAVRNIELKKKMINIALELL